MSEEKCPKCGGEIISCGVFGTNAQNQEQEADWEECKSCGHVIDKPPVKEGEQVKAKEFTLNRLQSGYVIRKNNHDWVFLNCIEQNAQTIIDALNKSPDETLVLNLLARIHRDGGHYVSKHGFQKAYEDADNKIANLIAEAQLAIDTTE
jgi:dissimilatory sulfite reductase (desulfoviridin) alpha/beta subunit